LSSHPSPRTGEGDKARVSELEDAPGGAGEEGVGLRRVEAEIAEACEAFFRREHGPVGAEHDAAGAHRLHVADKGGRQPGKRIL